ncbi:hypothetical protein WN943_018776 [Citrus x changshan-huyou]
MTVGTQWATDLQAQKLSTPSSLKPSFTSVINYTTMYLENDPEITIPLEELDMLSIVFGYKASYCYMTATEASASIITYPVNNVSDETSEEKGKALSWEKAFI